jgi:hypothetical protein
MGLETEEIKCNTWNVLQRTTLTNININLKNVPYKHLKKNPKQVKTKINDHCDISPKLF